MATDRFKRYQYAIVKYFRNRGYNVNPVKKTIQIDEYELNRKDKHRLSLLKSYGFSVIDLNRNEQNDIFYCKYEESFIDFADEIISMYGGSVNLPKDY